MSLNKCLKRMGLSGHEAVIMRALVREEKSTGPKEDAAKRAIQKRLSELQKEKSSVHQQIFDHINNPKEPTRKPIESIEKFSTKRTVDRAKEVGVNLTEDQAKHIAPLRKDVVTGFHAPEERIPAIERVQEHVKETGEQAHYLEADIRNLGGLNKAFGHHGANEHYKAFTDILSQEIKKTGGDVEFIRHGGDEVSAIIVNSTKEAIDAAAKKAQEEIARYTKKNNLETLEHPKHVGEEEHNGTGINYGISEINDRPIGDILSEADRSVEQKKLIGDKNVERGKTEKIGVVSSEGQSRGTEESPGRGTKETRSGESTAEAVKTERPVVEKEPVKIKEEKPKTEPKQEVKKEPAPLTKEAAERLAKTFTNQGSPTKTVEHPTKAGKYTIEPNDIQDKISQPDNLPVGSRSKVLSILHQEFGKDVIENLIKQKILYVEEGSKYPGRENNTKSVAISKAGVSSFPSKEGMVERSPHVSLFYDRLTPDNVAPALMHELGEHYGMIRMLGKNGYLRLLKDIKDAYHAGDTEIGDAWGSVKRRYGNISENDSNFVREVAAKLTESAPERGIVKRFLDGVRSWFYRTFGAGNVNGDLIRGLASSALRQAAEGKLSKNEILLQSSRESESVGNKGRLISQEINDMRSSRPLLGDLTPDQKASAERILGTPKTFKQRAQDFRKDLGKNLVQGVFDQFAPIRELSEEAYIKSRMSKGGDSTLEATMLYGKPYVDKDGYFKVDYSEKKGYEGFATVLAPLKGEDSRFLLWVASQRAERLKAVGLENLFSDQDIKNLKTLNQGKMLDGTDRIPAYEKAMKGMNEFNDSMLKLAVDKGLIDEETRQLYKDTPYVPFYRLQDEGIVGFGMKGGLINQTAWKKLKGGTEKINEDLLANMLQNWSHLITASAKNGAAKATLDAAVKAGVAMEVPNGTPGKGLVSYREGGMERTFAISDPHLADAVSSLEYAGLGPWAKPLTTMKHFLTTGVTLNPAFKIRNLIRDSVQSIAISDLSYNPLVNIGKGWKSTEMASEVRAQLLASGGMIRFGSMLDGQKSSSATKEMIRKFNKNDVILSDDNSVQKFWKEKIHPAFDAYQEMGDRGEQINRAALYQRLLDKGMSHGEAAFWARDLLDFQSSGKWTAVRFLTQTVPFLNARLQGLYKLGVAAKDDYKRFGYVVGGVALSSIGLMLNYMNDPDWKKREDFDRQNYWWFKVGDTAVRIPKPFETGAIGTIAEYGLELFMNDEMTGKRFLSNLGDIVGNQLNMNPIPQLVKPMMDVYANTDSFTKRPIENMAMQRLRPEDRYTERTSEFAKFFGSLGIPDPIMGAMGHYEPLSPVKIDALTKGYFGWLGTMATTALDYGIRPATDRGEKPDMQLKDAFLLGNFVESLPSGSSRYVTQMYEQAKEIEQAYASYHDALKRGDIQQAQSLYQENKDQISKYHMIETVKRNESKITSQIKMIEASKTLSGEQKRDKIDRLNQAKDQLSRLLLVSQ